MKFRAIFGLLALSGFSRAHAQCVDPRSLRPSVVQILRYFDPGESHEPGSIGTSGTAWFYQDDRTLVTIGHVAEDVTPTSDWKEIKISQGEDANLHRRPIQARLRRSIPLPDFPSVTIAILELAEPVPGAKILDVRREGLVPDEPLSALGYNGDRLRSAKGTFLRVGTSEEGKAEMTGRSLAELYDGNDRLALDYGVSGGPVFDCAGKVVLMIDNVITQPSPFDGGRISTAWGFPNVIAVPLKSLP